MWKTSPFCKWQMETKWFSSKKLQPKSGKAHCKIKTEVLLNKCSERDPWRLFEEWLKHWPKTMKNSVHLYLATIPRPTTSVWYVKSQMGEHGVSQIMKSVLSCLLEDCAKKIINHSTRKMVIAKLKEGGGPTTPYTCNHPWQVCGHARESSLDDYDETTEY